MNGFHMLHPVDNRGTWVQAIETLGYDLRDIYFSPDWAAMHIRPDATPYLAVWADVDKGFLVCQPILLRDVDGHYMDIGSMGYGGPLSSSSISSPEDGAAFEAAYAEWRRDHHVISEHYTLNPVFNSHQWVLLPKGQAEIVPRQQAYIVPCMVPEAALNRVRDTRRQSIAKAADGVCDPYASPAVMQELYDEAVARKGAEERYRLPPDHFSELRGTFGNKAHFISTAPASSPADVCAIATFLMGTCTAYYYLAATVEQRRQGYADAVIMAGLEAARRHGCQWLHLGGGMKDGDTLASYKKSFGAIPRRVYSVCRVYDPEAYMLLTGDADRDPDFFPAYRAKVLT